MIRIILSFTKIILGLVAAIAFASCNISGINGNGNVTTSTREVAEFTSVAADRGMEVIVQQSDSRSVIVEADSNLHKNIITTVENGVLRVSSDENIFNASTLKVIVKMPVIRGLETSGGASIKSANTLRSNAINMVASSGSEMEINLESDKVLCEASSGSHITVRGKALSLDTSSSSGSEVDATGLLANDVTAQANSGSSAEVHPIVMLDAKASSGSSVNYHSIPKNIKVEESSGGSVSQE
ncbi:MAG TPA: head GIN domain-containing protein [Flavobacterium sp.]|jgi:hypothetical protein